MLTDEDRISLETITSVVRRGGRAVWILADKHVEELRKLGYEVKLRENSKNTYEIKALNAPPA